MTTPDFLQANRNYAANFEKPERRAFKNVIIVTCMDPRVNPYDQLGLKLGEAITIRNAGASVKDALRSIMVARHFIGVTGEIAVFHHKDCGMSRVTTDEMRALVKRANPGREDVSRTVDHIDFHHISDIEESVKDDVDFLVSNPLVKKLTKITGWVYDVDTGKISKVVEGMARDRSESGATTSHSQQQVVI
ncbi:carbonic anhydrase [Mycena vulgaris]|nr:carbonic anhydrase [Mycena vulgaris]